jgi:glucosyl-dolichyl phosphate glucuronosyltransferase
MKLDVVIPTYNRSGSLERAIRSLISHPAPDGMQLRVIAVDNRSTDDTRVVVERLAAESAGEVVYVAENQGQGRSFALNTGIRSSDADLIAFIDDDEEVDQGWLETIKANFRDTSLDFLGGPYHPVWPSKPPAWVDHPHIRCAIGWAEFGDLRKPFTADDSEALLMGGNCVFRRGCLERVGFYSTALGRSGTRLFAGEDSDMHRRLIEAKMQGVYDPALIVRHHIAQGRMKKSYLRSWVFWAAASEGYFSRSERARTPLILGIPRYLYRKLLMVPVRWCRSRFGGRSEAETFNEELTLFRFSGYFWGRNLLRLQSDQTSQVPD